jgi:hypothetical protein
MKKKSPMFASLFLNAGAHIQHHYLFNSAAYSGDQANPEWYANPDEDPVLSVYTTYDRIVGTIARLMPGARLMIATGLHQDPHPKVTYYWRLKDHAAFLGMMGVEFEEVLPRMSRDFLVRCRDRESAAAAERSFLGATGSDGMALFSVDNRGTDLFVMFEYPKEIKAGFGAVINERKIEDLSDHVVFVAIKNGQHNSDGYLIDTGKAVTSNSSTIPLESLPEIIRSAFLQGHDKRDELPAKRAVTQKASRAAI